ncbi:KR domain-containing protein [Trichoderma compactum]
MLHKLKEDEYADLQHMVGAASAIVWVTKGGTFATENPLSALSNGFGRNVRAEREGYRFVRLDLEEDVTTESAANSITKVYMRLSTSPAITENEYAVKDGNLFISRLIEVKVKAVGLNFKDVMIAMGQLSDTWLGNECSGVITRVGKDVSDFTVGDRVCSVGVGTFRTFYRDDARLFQRIPDHMSFAEAAALPLVYWTAYYSLFELARLKKGESVLIHAAAGGVGQAAIVLSQLIGAEIFVTVSTAEKKHFLMETYNIREDRIFSSRDLSFAKGVMRLTNQRGVDVVLNSLSGEALRQSWELMAPSGRFIEIGRRDIDLNRRLEMSVFARGATFHLEIMDLAREKKISPAKPLNLFPYAKMEAAFRFMQAAKHIGKIILEPHDDDVALPPMKIPRYFDENASYLISGGLGGLARSMVRWMVDKNLKNVILCSRSGPNSDKGKAMAKELRERGVNAAIYACDVSNAVELAAVLEDCARKMPPIKGCIQSAMVLRDSTFENMSYADFQEPLRSKVPGTWNLHSMLPDSLDFFVMLSSSSGINGTRGQANYAAGNTFQDTLAHHRVSQGLHAIAIDLGFVLSVGYVAEGGNAEIDNNLSAWGFMGIREEEFLAIIEYCVNPSTSRPTPITCQVVTGIENPALMRAKGLEKPYYFKDPFFSHLQIANREENSAGLGGDDQERELTAQTIAALRSAKSLDEAAGLIRAAFVAKLCKVLSINPDDLDVNKPLYTYGVDSLVAVVIRYWLFRDYHADVPVFDIMGGSTITGLSLKIAAKTKFVDKSLIELEEQDREAED